MKKRKSTTRLRLLGRFVILALVLAYPAIARSQNIDGIVELFEAIGSIVAMLLPIVAGIALLAFFWGLAKFIWNAGDEEARSQGKYMMLWSIVALFVLVFVWGLVTWLADALGVEFIESMPAPTIEGLE